jgi:hypothetical protein
MEVCRKIKDDPMIELADVAEAIQYRMMDRYY